MLYFHKSLNKDQQNIQSVWISTGVNENFHQFSVIRSLITKCFNAWYFGGVLTNLVNSGLSSYQTRFRAGISSVFILDCIHIFFLSLLYVRKLNLFSWPDLHKLHPLKANQAQFVTGTSSAASYLDGMLEQISTIYNSKQSKEILAVVEGLSYRLIVLLCF